MSISSSELDHIDRNEIIEECALVVDQCNHEGPYQAIGAAARIRQLKSSVPLSSAPEATVSGEARYVIEGNSIVDDKFRRTVAHFELHNGQPAEMQAIINAANAVLSSSPQDVGREATVEECAKVADDLLCGWVAKKIRALSRKGGEPLTMAQAEESARRAT